MKDPNAERLGYTWLAIAAIVMALALIYITTGIVWN